MSSEKVIIPLENKPGGLSLESTSRGLFFGGSRALLYSHVAVEMLRKQLFHQLGDELARAILAQSSRHGGFNDAQLVLQEHSFSRIEDMIAAQYRYLTASGFGDFTIMDLVVNKASREAYVRVKCDGSPEAESHRRLFGTATTPACCHLVGYSTGWTTAMAGFQLLTIETHCVAKGDDHCEMESMPYADFVGPEAAFWKRAFESTSASLAQELQEKLSTIQAQLETIAAQKKAIDALSTPILQVADDLLVLPIIGNIDRDRAQTMTERLLHVISDRAARGVILDVTGVDVLDTVSGSHLLHMARAAILLGARIVITGISPAVAHVLVAESVDISGIPTLRTLQDGLQYLQRS